MQTENKTTKKKQNKTNIIYKYTHTQSVYSEMVTSHEKKTAEKEECWHSHKDTETDAYETVEPASRERERERTISVIDKIFFINLLGHKYFVCACVRVNESFR